MKKNVVLKKLVIFGGIMLLIFTLINIIWYVGIKMKYTQYAKDMTRVISAEEYDVGMTSYVSTIDGYTCSLKMPDYLGDNGFLSIAKEEGYVATINENGIVTEDNGVFVTLFIWPKAFEECEYGINIWREKDGLWEQIYIDKDGKYISHDPDNVELNEYLESMIKENENEVVKLLELAEKCWDLE